jgi:hypothetical protein
MRLQGLAWSGALFALLLSAARVQAQGPFQNLNFEAATIQQAQSPGLVSAAAALPGWDTYIGTNLQAQVGYNLISLGTTAIALLGTNGSSSIYNSLEGGFSVLLQGGTITTPGGGDAPADASISQTGLVPVGSQSIRFILQPDFGTFTVSLGGVSIPYFPLSTGPRYTLYGADVSSFAGQMTELRFSALWNPSGRSNWNLDSIQFSSLPTPEPGVFGLTGLGALVLGWRVLRQRR